MFAVVGGGFGLDDEFGRGAIWNYGHLRTRADSVHGLLEYHRHSTQFLLRPTQANRRKWTRLPLQPFLHPWPASKFQYLYRQRSRSQSPLRRHQWSHQLQWYIYLLFLCLYCHSVQKIQFIYIHIFFNLFTFFSLLSTSIFLFLCAFMYCSLLIFLENFVDFQ